MKKRAGESAEGDVTGHTWDGDLQEYNNPLPRWWLWMFYITLIFAAGYLYLYPGLGNYKGALNWTAQSQWQEEMADAKEKYDPIYAQYRNVAIEDLAKNPDATAMGKRLFLTYCVQCHGSDARGSTGYPNLTDDDWLWGNAPDRIQESIAQGRTGAMPAWQPILGDEGVDNVVEYVLTLSGRKADASKAEAGKALYDVNCIACHNPDGSGNQFLGAARLTDDTWLYGKSKSAIRKTIAEGRQGKMPAHGKLLGSDKVHVLAAYVYSLSQK
ncbi:MAG: cytochrome-c oxidase, cbb3-type subunit III [Chromatiales bacterium]